MTSCIMLLTASGRIMAVAVNRTAKVATIVPPIRTATQLRPLKCSASVMTFPSTVLRAPAGHRPATCIRNGERSGYVQNSLRSVRIGTKEKALRSCKKENLQPAFLKPRAADNIASLRLPHHVEITFALCRCHSGRKWQRREPCRGQDSFATA